MFLPFGLRTAPRIFNLFEEALHWIFEELVKWKVTHYLDDFLFVFLPGTDVRGPSRQYDDVLATIGFSGAAEKNMDGHILVSSLTHSRWKSVFWLTKSSVLSKL